MKSIVVFLSCCMVFLAMSAQQAATLSGRVVEAGSGEGLSAATVLLLQLPDSTGITGALSLEDGRFALAGIEKGNYVAKCTYVGYVPLLVPIYVGGKSAHYDLGKVSLSKAEVELTGVTIEAEVATVGKGLDKKSFLMDDQLAQSGGSVLDAMKGLPGISVDQEGKVELRGSDQVAITIDGKQSSLTGFGNQKGLDNIPASNIERIEIINNPSAKFDASGMAGVINIVYKKEKETGLNGEAGFTFGMGRFMTRKEDLNSDLGSYFFTPKYIPHLNLNYKTKKINAFLTSEAIQRKQLPKNEFSQRTYEDGRVIASQVAENRTQFQFILNGGLDFYLNDRNTLSLSSTFDREKHTDTSQVPYINLETGIRDRYWHWSESEVTGFMNYRAAYEHRFLEPGHELQFSGQFTRGWEDETYLLNDSSSVRQAVDSTHIVAIENVYTFLGDYTKPLRSGRLELGTKLRIRRLPVTYTIGRGDNSVIHPGLGETSDWGENIYAGYVNYLLEKKRFDVEAGVRVEQTEVFYDLDPANQYYNQNDAYDYFKVYPNLRFTLRANDRNVISAFYNRRVDRPGEPELRVFPKYDDPVLLKVGNPYLRPQFTQTVEIAYKHIWEKATVYVSGYYRLIEDPFMRIYNSTPDTVNLDSLVVYKIYQNTGQRSELGTEVVFTLAPVKGWNLNGSVNLYQNNIEADTVTQLFPYPRQVAIDASSNWTWGGKLNNQFRLSKGVQLQLSGQYNGRRNLPQGFVLPRGSVDLGIKKSLFEGKGEITLAVSDILNTYGYQQEVIETTADANSPTVEVLYQNYYETQAVRIGFRYKF